MTRGKIHDYPFMTLNIANKTKVMILMESFIDQIHKDPIEYMEGTEIFPAAKVPIQIMYKSLNP